jgi:hypothetical protein
MNIVQRFRCLLGRHKRDRQKAVYDGQEFRSVCRGCGNAMVRSPHGWMMTADDSSDHAASSSG